MLRQKGPISRQREREKNYRQKKREQQRRLYKVKYKLTIYKQIEILCTNPETHSVEDAIEEFRTICLDKKNADIKTEREKEKSTQKRDKNKY